LSTTTLALPEDTSVEPIRPVDPVPYTRWQGGRAPSLLPEVYSTCEVSVKRADAYQSGLNLARAPAQRTSGPVQGG
jgi:hypothetical protein